MKKKLVSILLIGAMFSTLLAGCGKEATVEVVTSETVETVEETTQEEMTVEETIPEETTVEEELSFGALDTSNVGEVAIKGEEGKTIVKDFGSVTPISTENKMTTYEIVFYDYAFKVTLPQDMGNNYVFEPNKYLALTNKNQTKVFFALISEANGDYSSKTMEIVSDFYDATYEPDWLFEKDDNLQLVRCKLKGNRLGLSLVYYENDYYGYFEKDFQFFYGEMEDIFNDEIANNVSKSIELIDKENTKASDNVSVEITSTGINSDIATKFGLNNVDLSGINTSVTQNNDSLILSLQDKEKGIKDPKAEIGNEILKLFKEKLGLYKDTNETPLDDYTFIEDDEKSQMVNAYYKSNDKWFNVQFQYLRKIKIKGLDIIE